MKQLNLGSGKNYRNGWVNMDIHSDFKKDVTHDFNKFPYPFKENTFDLIELRFVFEHLENPIRVLKELIRIGKNNCKIIILTSHANSYAQWSDLQHRNHMNEHILDDWQLEEYGLKKNLKLVKFTWVWDKSNWWKKYIPLKSYLKIFFNGLYDNMRFELKVIKDTRSKI